MALNFRTLQLTSFLSISSPQTSSFSVSSPKACNLSIVASLGYPSGAHFKPFSLEHITSFAKGTRTFADVFPHQILRFNLHASSKAYSAELASGNSGDDGGIGIGSGGGRDGGRNYGCRVGIRFHPIKNFHTCALNSTHSDLCTGRAFALIWALQSVGSSNLQISCRRYSDVSVCSSKVFMSGSINRVSFEKDIFENNVNAEEREEMAGSVDEGQSDVEEAGLIPQQWRLLQVDLHKTKAEKKLELRLQELENVKRKALECQLKRQKIVEVSKSCDESDEGITLSDQEAVPGRLSQPFIEQDSVSSETTARSNVKKRNGTQQTSLTAQRKKLDSDLDLLFTNDELACLKRSAPDLTKIHCEKWPALHALVASGQFFLLDEFLKSEIDVNAYDEDGYTAVHRAVMGRKETAVSQLLRAGADVNIYDKDGASLLHFSVQTGSLNLVRLLVKYGVDVNHADEDGWTPLHVAALTGREDIVRHLLGSGADKHLKTKDGHTPLDICLALGKGFRTYAVAKSLKRLPKVDMPTAGLVDEAEDNLGEVQYS